MAVKLLLFLFILSSLFKRNSGSFSQDLQYVKDYYNATSDCTFLHSEINSKSIQFFPKCDQVYGIIVINSNNDLNEVQLKNSFRNMQRLYGGLRIENSSLTHLNIFNTYNFSFFCEAYGVFINNNSNLMNITSLSSFHFYPEVEERTHDCNFEIQNNSVLDVEDFCDTGALAGFTYIKSEGNLKDCKCQGDKITSSTLHSYQNCTNLHNGLNLINITTTNLSDFSALSNIQLIRGFIDIQKTYLQNLSFLKNWNRWVVQGNMSLIFNLQDNPNMTKLGYPVIEKLNFNYNFKVLFGNVENLHPDFCMTIEELIFFAEQSLFFSKLEANLCEETGNLGKKHLCKFESMDDLLNNCDVILGNVRVKSGEEENFTKLNEVKYLIGSIAVINTTLEHLAYIGFYYIISLNDSLPVVQITGNQNLWNTTFGGLMNIITRGPRVAIIQDNSPNILRSNNCKIIYPEIEKQRESYYVALNYTGADCGGERVELPYSLQPLVSFFLTLITTVILVF